MTMTDFAWELAYIAPTFLVLCVALYFCFVRRRDNPRGVVFLGLAILVVIAQVACSFLVHGFLMGYGSSGSIGIGRILGFVMTMSGTVGNAALWILVTAAVFARRAH